MDEATLLEEVCEELKVLNANLTSLLENQALMYFGMDDENTNAEA